MVGSATSFANTVIGSLMHFASILQIISIIAGISLFLSALFAFKRYAQMRTMMSHQMTMAKPLTKMLAGIMLLALPLMIRTFSLAFWGQSNPLAYTGGNESGWAPLIPVVIDAVRLVGVFAFIRGIFLIPRAGVVGGQPGVLSKAILHMFGGILCINVVATHQLMKSILPI